MLLGLFVHCVFLVEGVGSYPLGKAKLSNEAELGRGMR